MGEGVVSTMEGSVYMGIKYSKLNSSSPGKTVTKKSAPKLVPLVALPCSQGKGWRKEPVYVSSLPKVALVVALSAARGGLRVLSPVFYIHQSSQQSYVASVTPILMWGN